MTGTSKSDAYFFRATSLANGTAPTASPVTMEGSVNPYRGMIKNPNTGSARMPLADEIAYTMPVLPPASSAVDDTMRSRSVGTMPRNINGGTIRAALTRTTAARGLTFSKAIVNSDAD